MSLEVALSFLLYAFVSGITPGPANLCSLSVAMKTGKSVAIKQWYGLFTGYTIVALASVFIVYFISSAFESFIEVFSFIGAIYIAYLAISLLLQAIKPYDEIRNNRATGNFRTGLFAIWRGFSRAFCFKVYSENTTEFSIRSWDYRYFTARLELCGK